MQRQDQEKHFIQGYLADRKQKKFNQELDRAAEEARCEGKGDLVGGGGPGISCVL